jgi:hypothetical protein
MPQFPPEFGQAGLKGGSLGLSVSIVRQKAAHQHRHAPFLLARLRARRDWKRGPNSNSFDEIASSHCLPQGSGPRQSHLRLQQGFVIGEMGGRGRLQGSNPEPFMSALGQKRTSARVRVMSALPPKADIKTWRPVLSLSLSATLNAASNERSRLSDQLIIIVQPEIDLLRCRRLGGCAVWHQPRLRRHDQYYQHQAAQHHQFQHGKPPSLEVSFVTGRGELL